MADYVFNTALFPNVRAAIGLDLDEVNLPDSTLALPVYTEETERFINRSLTEAQRADPYADDADYIATLYMASLLVPTLRVVEGERFPGGSITYAKTDLTAIAARLLASANARIADITAVPGTSLAENTNFFRKARRKSF